MDDVEITYSYQDLSYSEFKSLTIGEDFITKFKQNSKELTEA